MVREQLAHSRIMKIISTRWEIFILCFASAIPCLWFRDGKLITGADLDQSLFPIQRLSHRLQTWDVNFMGGTDRSNNVASLPFIAVQAALEYIGFDAVNVQRWSLCFWMFFLLFSTYYALNYITKIIAYKNSFACSMARLTGSLFFGVNFYNNFLWHRLQLQVPTAAMLMIIIGTIMGLFLKQILHRDALWIITLGAVLTGSTGIQPPLILVCLLFVICLYFFLNSVKADCTPFGYKHNVTSIYLYVGVIFILASSYWIIPLGLFIVNAGYLNANVGLTVFNVKNLLEWVSTTTSFINIFRGMGDVTWWDSWGGAPYWYEFKDFQSLTAAAILSFLSPIIILYPLIAEEDRTSLAYKLITFLFIALLVFIFFSKGTHEPLGAIYLWIVNNIPGFWSIRAPWQKFGLVVSALASILYGISIGYIALKVDGFKYNGSKKTVRLALFVRCHFIIFTLFSLYFVNAHFINGIFLPDNKTSNGFHGKYNLGFHHDIPSYVIDTKHYIEQNSVGGAIFLTPDLHTSVYTWGFGGAADIFYNIFDQPILSRQYGEGAVPPNSVDIYQDMIARGIVNNPATVSGLLGMLNVEYIVQRNDLVSDFYGNGYPPTFMANQLAAIPGLKLVRTFGRWDIYRLDDRYRVPRLAFATCDNVSELPETLYDSGIARSFSSDSIGLKYKSIQSTRNALTKLGLPCTRESRETNEFINDINYRKISDTSIVLNINGASGRKTVMFLNSYHPMWQIYLMSNNSVFESGVASLARGVSGHTRDQELNWLIAPLMARFSGINRIQAAHLLVDGYGNGWAMDFDKLCYKNNNCETNADGSYNLKLYLEFRSQAYFLVGLSVTLLMLLLSSSIILLSFRNGISHMYRVTFIRN